jgi:hypothetical protein
MVLSRHIYRWNESKWELVPPLICSTESCYTPWPRARDDFAESSRPHIASRLPVLGHALDALLRTDAMELSTSEMSGSSTNPRIIDGLGTFLKQISRLPPELLRMVESYSTESTLWRLLAALEWPTGLGTANTWRMQLRALGSWQRGSGFVDTSTAGFKILGLDELGIKEIRTFDRLPTNAQMTSMWYAVLDTADVQDTVVKVKVHPYMLYMLEANKKSAEWTSPSEQETRELDLVGYAERT